ncbi:MAG: hypothetical protein ACRC67_13715 [Inquilinus sp.]|uniref:hypothetical protein n=1 Tax=Inquilinus sp. TaxID=1932117 RepID=UPI003F2A9BE3
MTAHLVQIRFWIDAPLKLERARITDQATIDILKAIHVKIDDPGGPDELASDWYFARPRSALPGNRAEAIFDLYADKQGMQGDFVATTVINFSEISKLTIKVL